MWQTARVFIADWKIILVFSEAEFTLFIPKLPPNGDEDEACEVTVVIKVSGRVIPEFNAFSSSVRTQFAGEPG